MSKRFTLELTEKELDELTSMATSQYQHAMTNPREFTKEEIEERWSLMDRLIMTKIRQVQS
jgi:hypothetical protein